MDPVPSLCMKKCSCLWMLVAGHSYKKFSLGSVPSGHFRDSRLQSETSLNALVYEHFYYRELKLGRVGLLKSGIFLSYSVD